MTSPAGAARRSRAGRTLGVLLLVLSAAASSGAAEPSEFSPAEKLVFTEHHLANVKTATSLRYRFVKAGSLESGFEDEVRVDVTPNARGQSAVSGNFLSGERRETMPAIDEAQSNPAILYFLEHDIREMERLTKGKSNYFRKRIRMAMAEGASVRDTTVQYRGESLAAKEVSLAPYESDPMRNRFEKYATKRYVFVIASGVPGGLYQIRTSLPGALPGDAPVLEETMTLAGSEPVARAATPKKKP
ncbi:MAG TPA: hypothetical protein VFR90_17575 [Methylibium sp.]|uniref:hypothetical protein n=1 Tax=Methylibium sp. TaxID=2067992 RepID=UPI002DBB0643|nr:hypothetical protein [Methylibium sp.]HEU4460935.1 hypothetical protein [Methylibium sp.]